MEYKLTPDDLEVNKEYNIDFYKHNKLEYNKTYKYIRKTTEYNKPNCAYLFKYENNTYIWLFYSTDRLAFINFNPNITIIISELTNEYVLK